MLDCFLKNEVLTISFAGRMDSRASTDLESELTEKLAEITCKKIVFDLDGVDYIASAFLHICLVTAKKVGQENFSVINTKAHIKKTFIIAGLDQIFKIT